MFIDRIIIKLSAGRGGNGVVAWRREKYVPKGGPYGGNGGKGGSVFIEADPSIYALDWFRNKRLMRAENGRPGGTNQRRGRDGHDLVLRVPCGTLVKSNPSGALIADLTEPGQRVLICEGGKGGRGNASFKSATNRAPNKCTEGKPGTEESIELELKLIAEVGLVGFPNAGKSTLMGALTKANAKVGAYPFTTLAPNLGTIDFEDHSAIMIADIPGIIEGASQNRGLGLEFLRHIERTKILFFVLDASGFEGRSPINDWKVLQGEIRARAPELLERPFLVALNKKDVEGFDAQAEIFIQESGVDPKLIFSISAKEEEGVSPLIDQLKQFLAL